MSGRRNFRSARSGQMPRKMARANRVLCAAIHGMVWDVQRLRVAPNRDSGGSASPQVSDMIPISDDNPVRSTSYVSIIVIVSCVLAFVWELSLGGKADGALAVLGFTPDTLFHPENALSPWLGVPPAATILTSMFLHAGFLHIAGNMLYLWIFGNNIEDAMGHFKFAVFYLICGIAAALTMVLVDPASHTPIVGASGAISGVLGAYMLLFPRARIRVVVPLWFLFYPF